MKKNLDASAELIGIILMLIITISVFSVVYVMVLSDAGPEEKIYATIVGHMEDSQVVFENRMGESLDFNDTICFTIAGVIVDEQRIGDLAEDQSDDRWSIGERLVYNVSIPFVNVEADIANIESNSLVFWGTMREGYSVPEDVIIPSFSLQPRTFNIESMGGWITCTLSLPEPYMADMIDNSTVQIVNINNVPVSIFAEDKPVMQQNKMMVKFDRQVAKEYMSIGQVLVAVRGELYSGEVFEYFDIIRVI